MRGRSGRFRRRSPTPLRMRQFLADAAGMTVIIDRLLEFRADGVPAEVVWPAYERGAVHRRARRPRAPAPARDRGRRGGARVRGQRPRLERRRDAEPLPGGRGAEPLRAAGSGSSGSAGTSSASSSRSSRPSHDHVIHVPLQPRSEVPRYMRLADVLVQPGRPDAFNDYRFPSKLPEFFACGRPGRAPGDEPRPLRRRRRGLPPAPARRRARDRGGGRADPRRRRASRAPRSGAARGFAERTFSWQASAEKLLGLYDRALAVGPGVRRHAAVPVRLDASGTSRPPRLCDRAGLLRLGRSPARRSYRSGDLKDAQRPWVLQGDRRAAAPPAARLLEVGAGEPLVAAHAPRARLRRDRDRSLRRARPRPDRPRHPALGLPECPLRARPLSR